MRRAFICGCIASIAGLTALLFVSLFAFAYNTNFYVYAMENSGAIEQSGTDRPSVCFVAEDIVSFLRGNDGAFEREIVIDGALRAELNEREVTHMADVRRLFRLSQGVCAVCLVIAALFAVLTVRARRPRGAGWGLIAGVLLLAAAGVLVYARSLNETAFFDMFYRFHEIVFTNDLWQLDPRTDLMIRLMPTQFFMTFAGAIGWAWGGCAALTLAGGVWLAARGKRQRGYNKRT